MSNRSFKPNTKIHVDERYPYEHKSTAYFCPEKKAPRYKIMQKIQIQRNYGKLMQYGLPFSTAQMYRRILTKVNPLITEKEINQNMFVLSKKLEKWMLEAYVTEGSDQPPIYLRDFDFKIHKDEKNQTDVKTQESPVTQEDANVVKDKNGLIDAGKEYLPQKRNMKCDFALSFKIPTGDLQLSHANMNTDDADSPRY